MKSWWGKIQCNRFCFISVGVRTILRFWVGIKNLGQYEKLPWKKENFAEHFVVYEFFFGVAMFSWLFSSFF